MTDEKITKIVSDYLKENLSIYVDVQKAQIYYESDSVTTRVYLAGELIGEYYGNLSL